MADTNVRLVATIDATSKGLVDALNEAHKAVKGTTQNWQRKFEAINRATEEISEHVDRLGEALSRAGKEGIDTAEIQREVEALNEAKAVLEGTAEANSEVAETAKKAERGISDVADTSKRAAHESEIMDSRLKVAGVRLKDLRDAFGDGATQAAALGNLYYAAFVMTLNVITSTVTKIKEFREGIRQIEEAKFVKTMTQKSIAADETGDLAGKLRELYELREKSSGSEADKARESILVAEISKIQETRAEADRVTVAINGETVAQEKLRDAIAETLRLESQMRKSALGEQVSRDKAKLEELWKEYSSLEELPLDVVSNLGRQFEKLFKGDIEGLFEYASHPIDTLRGFDVTEDKIKKEAEYFKQFDKVLKAERELRRLSQSNPAEEFRSLAIAREADRRGEAQKAADEASARRAEYEGQARQSVLERSLPKLDRMREEGLRKIADEYAQNVANGVSAQTAGELRGLQEAELEQQIADEIKRQADAEAKQQAAMLDAMQARIDQYRRAYDKYQKAEGDVNRAQRALADAERTLARERQAEALRSRREAIRKRLASFGFSVAEGFDPSESASERNARVRNLRTDARIADKMAQWQAGKKVNFTPAEWRRLDEYQGLQEEDKALEAAQKQMDAAAKQESSAARLESASSALEKSTARLNERGNALEGLRAGLSGGLGKATAISYEDRFEQLHKDLREMLTKTYRVR